MTDPAELADSAGYAPWLTWRRRPSCSPRPTWTTGWSCSSAGPGSTSPSWRSPRRSARTSARGWRRRQREFLLRQQLDAIRKELGEDEPDGAADYRTRVEAGRPAREGPRGRAARGRQAGAGQRRLPRGGLDPHLARHRARAAVERPVPRTTPTSTAARAMLDADHAGLDDVKDRDPGVPGGAQPPGQPQPAGGRRPRLRRRAGAGRPARRRQDQPRRVGRPRAGPQVRPGLAGRRPRRGRDPRPPAHLRRRAARPDRPGASARPAR